MTHCTSCLFLGFSPVVWSTHEYIAALCLSIYTTRLFPPLSPSVIRIEESHFFIGPRYDTTKPCEIAQPRGWREMRMFLSCDYNLLQRWLTIVGSPHLTPPTSITKVPSQLISIQTRSSHCTNGLHPATASHIVTPCDPLNHRSAA